MSEIDYASNFISKNKKPAEGESKVEKRKTKQPGDVLVTAEVQRMAIPEFLHQTIIRRGEKIKKSDLRHWWRGPSRSAFHDSLVMIGVRLPQVRKHSFKTTTTSNPWKSRKRVIRVAVWTKWKCWQPSRTVRRQ